MHDLCHTFLHISYNSTNKKLILSDLNCKDNIVFCSISQNKMVPNKAVLCVSVATHSGFLTFEQIE